MSAVTEISWCHSTFNPWLGCTQVSPACDFCYAKSISERFGKDVWGKDAPRTFTSDDYWYQPIKWNRKAAQSGRRWRVFCGSMCDVMEDRTDLVTRRFQLYSLIHMTPYIDWLLLTKRPQNFRRFLPKEWMDEPMDNVWLMTTVETGEYFWRIDALRNTPAVVRGLSIEPMLSDMPTIANYLDGIHWCIVGGESGHNARPVHPDWVRRVRDLCKERGIAFLFKQWGEWAPASQVSAPKPITHAMTLDGRMCLFDRESMVACDPHTLRWEGLRRLGKSASGSILDDCDYREFPR